MTGGSSGIGAAIALRLAELDMRICIVGRDQTRLDRIVEQVSGKSHAVAYRADISVDRQLTQLARSLARDCPQLDVLVHSAAAIALGRLSDLPVEDFDRQYWTNVRAPYILTQALLPNVRACRGQIVFVNSSAGIHSGRNVGAYAASKHALKAIADSLRAEVNDEGVRVTTVYPGRTATAMQARIHSAENKPYRPEELMQAEDVACMVLHALTLPRTAEVTDLSIRPMQRPS